MNRILAISLLLALIFLPSALFAQGGRFNNVVFRPGVGSAGVNIAICAPSLATNAVANGALLTFTMASNPQTAGFATGGTLMVTGFTGADTVFNFGSISRNIVVGGMPILAVTPTSVIVATSLTHTATSTGFLFQMGNSTTSCAGLVPLFTDQTLTIGSINPVISDGFGNYGFWTTPGNYFEQFYGPTSATLIYSITNAGVGGGNVFTGTPNTFNNGGNATQAFYSTWGPVTPNSIQVQGGANSFNLNSPDVYLSRLDSTVGIGGASPVGCTPQVIFSPCDEPVTRIDFSNRQTTGVIPNMLGLAIVGNGFASNTPLAGFAGNFEVGLAVAMFDASTPNVVHMRNMNPFLGVEGLPTQLAGGSQTRSAFIMEGDLQNSSGADAVFNGTIGNYTGGISLISAGASNTIGLSLSGNGSISGTGWLTGVYITDVTLCGLCIYDFPTGPASPHIGEQIAASGAYGLVIGSGTISSQRNGDAALGNPTTYGILLDSKGTPGVVETQDSNTLAFAAKNNSSTPDYWRMVQTGSDNIFHFAFDGVDKFLFDKNGNSEFVGQISARGTTAFLGTLSFANITANRVYGLPNASGTICLTTTCGGGAGLTAPFTQYTSGGINFLGTGSGVGSDNAEFQIQNVALTASVTLGTVSGAGIFQVQNVTTGWNVEALTSSGSFSIGTTAASSTFLSGYFDTTLIASPGNPASGSDRIYFDSTTGNLTCLKFTGANCNPALTSVGLSTNSSFLTVGSSPLLANGTITLNLTTGLSANEFLATPNGSTGTVSLRAIVAADVPTLNQNTTGTAGNLSGTPALPNGTTATTQTVGDNTTKLATDAFVLANGTGNVLTTLGDLIYENATPQPTRLAGPTTPNSVLQILTNTPSGGAAQAEAWALAGVVPNAQTGASYTYLVTDRAGYTSFSNAGAIAVTLPSAASSGFGSNFVNVSCDIGAGTATITPTTSNISYSNGSSYTSAATSMPLSTGQCAWIYSDNTNYFAIVRSGATVNPTFDKSVTGLSNPTADSTFTQPSTSTTGWTLAGTAPASVSTTPGTAATTLFNVNGVPGGATTNASGTGGVGSSPSISAGAGGAASGATASTGGAGGSLNFTTGAGGAGAGTGVNSNGGNFNVTLGIAGTGGSGTAGKAGVVAVSGPTAGLYYYTQGTAPTTANTQIPANSIFEYAPVSVISYGVAKPGVSANGLITNNVASTLDTQGFSGDANHSTTISFVASQTIGSTSLCSTANCGAGTYMITIFVDVTTACTTSGTLIPWVGWTDDQGAKGSVSTTFFGNGFGTGFAPSTGTLTDTSTANFMQGSYVVRSTGAAAINYGYTTSACGSGSLAGKMYLNVLPVG